MINSTNRQSSRIDILIPGAISKKICTKDEALLILNNILKHALCLKIILECSLAL